MGKAWPTYGPISPWALLFHIDCNSSYIHICIICCLGQKCFLPICFLPLLSWHSILAHNFHEMCHYFSISDFCIMKNLSVYFAFLSMLLCYELDSPCPPNATLLLSVLMPGVYLVNHFLPLCPMMHMSLLHSHQTYGFPCDSVSITSVFLWIHCTGGNRMLNPAIPQAFENLHLYNWWNPNTEAQGPTIHHLPHPFQRFSWVYLTLDRRLWTHLRSQETGFQLLASTKDTCEAKMPTPWRLPLAGLGCPWSANGSITKAYERGAH